MDNKYWRFQYVTSDYYTRISRCYFLTFLRLDLACTTDCAEALRYTRTVILCTSTAEVATNLFACGVLYCTARVLIFVQLFVRKRSGCKWHRARHMSLRTVDCCVPGQSCNKARSFWNTKSQENVLIFGNIFGNIWQYWANIKGL